MNQPWVWILNTLNAPYTLPYQHFVVWYWLRCFLIAMEGWKCQTGLMEWYGWNLVGNLVEDQFVYTHNDCNYPIYCSNISHNDFWLSLTNIILSLVYDLIYKGGSFPGGSVLKNPPANAGDAGLISESGRAAGVGHGDPLQYSCLGNPMDREAWWATVHGVAKELDTTWWLNNNNNNT